MKKFITQEELNKKLIKVINIILYNNVIKCFNEEIYEEIDKETIVNKILLNYSYKLNSNDLECIITKEISIKEYLKMFFLENDLTLKVNNKLTKKEEKILKKYYKQLIKLKVLN